MDVVEVVVSALIILQVASLLVLRGLLSTLFDRLDRIERRIERRIKKN